MNLVEISHMKKQFGDLEVLSDISLSVQQGEVVSIIGPSGSGKSTLLRCATLLEKMDGGTLNYGGEPVVWERNGKMGRLRTEIIPGRQRYRDDQRHIRISK